MTLHRKLVLAQAPLALGLVLVGMVSAVVTTRLGERSRLILADNYRSVLAAQRMKEALERIDSHAVFMMVRSQPLEARSAIAGHRAIFESELRVQEGNITETSENAVTDRLRAAWNAYRRSIDEYLALPTGQEARGGDGGDKLSTMYFAILQPSFLRVKELAEEILSINQDAMVKKSDGAVESARVFERVVMVAVFLALLLGVVASTTLTSRLLGPLRVVNAAVRRFGGGDLAARAIVQGQDEIAALAVEFNRLAEKLERYRASTLEELIHGQQAAQAAIDGLPDPVLLLDAKGQGCREPTRPPRRSCASIPIARPARIVCAHRSGVCARWSIAWVVTCWRARVPTCRAGSRMPCGWERPPRANGSSCRAPRRSTARRGPSPGPPSCCRMPPEAVSLRRAQEQPGRHGGARIQDPAHLAAHGAAHVHRAGGRTADGQAGRPSLRGPGGLREIAGDRR
jgi:HAMP domain-containing protein